MKYYSCEAIARPEVRRWHSRLRERYLPPEAKLAVLLPCSAKKPYSNSKSHKIFRRALKMGARGKLGLLHEITLTSPLGVVPRELETVFPACCYDTSVSGYWSEEEKAVVRGLLRDYQSKSSARLIGYCSGAYAEILDSLGIEVVARENILKEESLGLLKERVREILGREEKARRDRHLERLRSTADFQFGIGVGKLLLPKGVKLKGRELRYRGGAIARLNQLTGLLNLTLAGAEALAREDRYTVHVDFRPRTNSILCPGVMQADRDIRPRDEVVVMYRGDMAGVGKAVLSGAEMLRASYGQAVKLRRRK